jgi:hypothetical protein
MKNLPIHIKLYFIISSVTLLILIICGIIETVKGDIGLKVIGPIGLMLIVISGCITLFTEWYNKRNL